MALAQKKKKIFDGRYEVLSIVGRGAASVVYHARHAMTQSSEVALKVLLNQKGGSSNTDRLRKEALAMVSSRHRYVVRLDDFHSVKDLCYLSMEYAREGDLRKYSQKFGGKLPMAQAEMFFRQAAEALNFVHRVGITHRDIKPDNILVLNEKETRLTDFGVAVLPGELASLEDLKAGVGTMSYMAPEVLEGLRCDKLSDIYALGVTFYELITGIHPFENAPLIKQLEIREDKNITPIAKLAKDISPHLAEVIMRCLQYHSDQRFQTMGELVRFLNQDNSAKSSQAASPQKTSEKPTPRKNQPEQHPQKSSSHKQQSREKERHSQRNQDQGKSPKIKEFPREKQQAKPQPEPVLEEKAPEKVEAPPVAEPEVIIQAEEPVVETTIEDTASDELSEESEAALEEEFAIDTGESEVIIDTPQKPIKPLRDPNSGRARSNEKPFKDKPNISKGGRTISAPSKPWLFNLFILGLVLYAGYFILGKIFSLNIFSSSESAQLQNIEVESGIPAVSEALTTFPQLPPGMYVGQIENLNAANKLPLILISLADVQKLVVIIGQEGWTPEVVSTEAKDTDNGKEASSRIRVASNGIVMDLAGEIQNDTVIGTYLNAITGEEGQWQVTPVK